MERFFSGGTSCLENETHVQLASTYVFFMYIRTCTWFLHIDMYIKYVCLCRCLFICLRIHVCLFVHTFNYRQSDMCFFLVMLFDMCFCFLQCLICASVCLQDILFIVIVIVINNDYRLFCVCISILKQSPYLSTDVYPPIIHSQPYQTWDRSYIYWWTSQTKPFLNLSQIWVPNHDIPSTWSNGYISIKVIMPPSNHSKTIKRPLFNHSLVID